jgi:helix-turn-helix, Psq domain
MGHKPLSDRVKAQKARARQNASMRQAIDEYKRQEFKPKELRKSYRQVADDYDVSKSTLQRLVQGGISMSAFNAGKQRLTAAKERVVVDFCLESAD